MKKTLHPQPISEHGEQPGQHEHHKGQPSPIFHHKLAFDQILTYYLHISRPHKTSNFCIDTIYLYHITQKFSQLGLIQLYPPTDKIPRSCNFILGYISIFNIISHQA